MTPVCTVESELKEVHSQKSKPRRCVEIHPNNCKACGLCIVNCPRGVLKSGNQINVLGYEATIVANDKCIGCGICYYICPEPDAISVKEC